MRELGLVAIDRGSHTVLDASVVTFQVLQGLGDAVLRGLQCAIGLRETVDIVAGLLAEATTTRGAGKHCGHTTKIVVQGLGQLRTVERHRAVLVE
ncbi:hypothetical protein D9M69_388480 [compost metagenome]